LAIAARITPRAAKAEVIWLLSTVQKYAFLNFLFANAQKIRSVVVIFAQKY
jgi:hypothetical protein